MGIDEGGTSLPAVTSLGPQGQVRFWFLCSDKGPTWKPRGVTEGRWGPGRVWSLWAAGPSTAGSERTGVRAWRKVLSQDTVPQREGSRGAPPWVPLGSQQGQGLAQAPLDQLGEPLHALAHNRGGCGRELLVQEPQQSLHPCTCQGRTINPAELPSGAQHPVEDGKLAVGHLYPVTCRGKRGSQWEWDLPGPHGFEGCSDVVGIQASHGAVLLLWCCPQDHEE